MCKLGYDIDVNLVLGIFFFGLGSIIGSFLNVVLFRYNTGKGIMGRSQCFSCKRHLGPIDLVPVLSYLAFRGKCRTCKSEVSFQYPAVELLTGFLFLATYWTFAPAALVVPEQFIIQTFYTCAIMALLVLIVVYDMRHKIIPDLFSYSFAALSFLTLFVGFTPQGNVTYFVPTLLTLSSGIILAFPFYILWLVSDGRWMGLGDAKLALGIGWFLGLSAGASAIIFGFWIGAAVSVLLLAAGKIADAANKTKGVRVIFRKVKSAVRNLFGIQLPSLSMKSEIPFAPFLIAGLLIAFFFGYTIFEPLEYIL